MRWICLSLVLINVALAVWGWAMPEHEGKPVKVAAPVSVDSNAAGLVMLGEAEGYVASGGAGDVVERPISEIPVLPEEPAEGAAEEVESALCEILGPFENDVLAEEMVERLKAIDVSSEVRSLQLPAGPGYWVYLEPEVNRKAALRKLAELQSRGVDSYVIPKGELANGISLGMFSKKSLADKRFEEVEKMSLNPKVDVIERTYREIWVMLGRGEDEKMSDISWSRVLEDKKNLERRENYCLDVAS